MFIFTLESGNKIEIREISLTRAVMEKAKQYPQEGQIVKIEVKKDN